MRGGAEERGAAQESKQCSTHCSIRPEEQAKTDKKERCSERGVSTRLVRRP